MSYATKEKANAYQRAWKRKQRERLLREDPDWFRRRAVYARKWYLKNRARALAKQRAKYQALRALGGTHPQSAANRAFLAELKSKPCTDCGRTYPPCVMDFDHLDPSKKRGSIRKLLTHANGRARVLEEIAGCELVCANCHRIRTWNQKVRLRPGRPRVVAS